MRCLILAAGYATRLRPLTDNFPKPLLEVGGKPILDWLVEDIASTGKVDGFVVISNHKFAPIFEEWAASRPEDIMVVDDGTSTNETRLGAVRDIQFAVESLGLEDDFLVIAGDNLLDFSLSAFLDYSASKGTSCVMRYFEPSEARLRKGGVLQVDDEGLIIGMEEKPSEPKAHWACPPFYFYRREDAKRIPEAIASGCGVDAPGSLVAWLSSRVPVHAMEMPGRRYDIGDLKSYEAVKAEFDNLKK
ncbi:MAG: nucleotidyltransferase family protein [Bacteroidales bacterium]|nr:nucleotidyltransferase family protein [Bacteroidales bacterium]